MLKATIFATSLLWSGAAVAQSDLELMQTAENLGTLLASEGMCDLAYNQNSIEAFIDENVPTSRMEFPSNLKSAVMLAEFSLSDITESEKTAHCRAVENAARHYRFID